MKPGKLPIQPRGRAGLWTTMSAAINGGWGATFRMLVLIVALGAIGIGFIVAVGDGPTDTIVRALLSVL